ncbi:TY-Chap domain-containing protein [Streptomyces sp. NPDC002309]
MNDWNDFRSRLLRDLANLADEDIVILLHGDRGVQFAQHPRMLLTEAIMSPRQIPARPLPEQQHTALVALGWIPPDVPHFTNWHLGLPWPATTAQYDATAARSMRTLRDVVGVPSPSDLRIKAWSDRTREPLRLSLAQ